LVSGKTLQDGALAGAAMRQVLRGMAAGASRMVPSIGRNAPQKLIIAPQDIRTSDPTIASEIYAGQIKLAGKLLETHGRSPFEVDLPSEAFAVDLHGFSWLRHLRAAETALAKVNGRALVADWISGRKGRHAAVARRSDVTARRVMSWLSQAPLLLEGADAAFYSQFVQAVTMDARRLEALSRSAPPTEVKLLIQIAITHFAVSSSESDGAIKEAALRLCDLLDEQVLTDGGHVSRNPAVVLELLLDLLPLKLAFLWRRIQTPQPIISAIDRMMPMLRMMRHSDGAVALFNGMGATRADLVAAVLAQDDAVSPPPLNAPYTGYQRVSHGKSVLIIDAGTPPKPPLAEQAHAAPGAFELSANGHRLIVNCGAPPSHRSEMRSFSRLTSAHSTLVVNDRSIGHLARTRLMNALVGEQYSGGASSVSLTRSESGEGTLLTVEHDGYRKSHGLLHERKLLLSADGAMLEGDDTLKLKGGKTKGGKPKAGPYMLRFHLHPLVKASLASDGLTVRLTLPNGIRWLFDAGGLPVMLEESIFFASPEGLRRSEQITVAADIAERATIAWTFRLEEAA
jgi:uncharacterized heparinase superfamily protein